MSDTHTGSQHARQEIVGKRQEGSGLFSCLFVSAIAALLVGCFFVFVLPMFRAQNLARTMFEMKQLEQALSFYELEFGSFPPGIDPAQIQRHVENAKPLYLQSTNIETLFPNDISDLDERELLPLWLSGAAWDSITQSDEQRHVFSDF